MNNVKSAAGFLEAISDYIYTRHIVFSCSSLAWGRARYLSVTVAPHNIIFLRVSGEETFLFIWNLKAIVRFELKNSDFPSRQL